MYPTLQLQTDAAQRAFVGHCAGSVQPVDTPLAFTKTKENPAHNNHRNTRKIHITARAQLPTKYVFRDAAIPKS